MSFSEIRAFPQTQTACGRLILASAAAGITEICLEVPVHHTKEEDQRMHPAECCEATYLWVKAGLKYLFQSHSQSNFSTTTAQARGLPRTPTPGLRVFTTQNPPRFWSQLSHESQCSLGSTGGQAPSTSHQEGKARLGSNWNSCEEKAIMGLFSRQRETIPRRGTQHFQDQSQNERIRHHWIARFTKIHDLQLNIMCP